MPLLRYTACGLAMLSALPSSACDRKDSVCLAILRISDTLRISCNQHPSKRGCCACRLVALSGSAFAALEKGTSYQFQEPSTLAAIMRSLATSGPVATDYQLATVARRYSLTAPATRYFSLVAIEAADDGVFYFGG